MKFEISEEQVNIIKTFLGRTQLQGQEVPAYNQVVDLLGNPIKEEK